jgi:hypothetical protein
MGVMELRSIGAVENGATYSRRTPSPHHSRTPLLQLYKLYEL